jgi:hypothetical protein
MSFCQEKPLPFTADLNIFEDTFDIASITLLDTNLMKSRMDCGYLRKRVMMN